MILENCKNMDSKRLESLTEFRVDTCDGFSQQPQPFSIDEQASLYEKTNPTLFDASARLNTEFNFEALKRVSDVSSLFPQDIVCPRIDDENPSTTNIQNTSTKENLDPLLSSATLNRSEMAEYPFSSRQLQEHNDSIKSLDGLISDDKGPVSARLMHSKENLEHTTYHLNNPKRKYMELLPLFSRMHGHNFKELLLRVLRECLDQFPLDDFYNLLYSSALSLEVIDSSTKILEKINSKMKKLRLEGLEYCHLVLETFRRPHMDSLVSANAKPSIKPLNFQQVCKQFLAIKILLDLVKVKENTSIPGCRILRTSIYKAYVILCKKLIEKQYRSSNGPEKNTDIILNQSQLGKLFRLTFPNVSARRFGRKGDTKYYYKDLFWNDQVVGKYIKALLHFSLSDIDSKFKLSQENRFKAHGPSRSQHSSSGHKNVTSFPTPAQQIRKIEPTEIKPLHSFVCLSTTFPVLDCFPRSWKIIPGETPKQSQWAREIIERSANFLENHGIEVNPLVLKIRMAEFSAPSAVGFLEDVLLKIRNLKRVSASDEMYLHFYLIVSTSILPIAFASDIEILTTDKPQLRTSLSDFVTKLESSFMDIPLLENLMSFANVIKKMISFNTLILSSYEASSIKEILGTMIDETPPISSSGKILIENLIIRQSTIVSHAFNSTLTAKNSNNSSVSPSVVAQNLTRAFTKLFLSAAKLVSLIGESQNVEEHSGRATYDLLFHLLKCSMEVFHESFLADTEVIHLPIKLIESFLVSMNSEFQNSSFQNFAKRDNGLSKEVFRTWWVHSNAFQQYIGIIAEISALSFRLS